MSRARTGQEQGKSEARAGRKKGKSRVGAEQVQGKGRSRKIIGPVREVRD